MGVVSGPGNFSWEVGNYDTNTFETKKCDIAHKSTHPIKNETDLLFHLVMTFYLFIPFIYSLLRFIFFPILLHSPLPLPSLIKQQRCSDICWCPCVRCCPSGVLGGLRGLLEGALSGTPTLLGGVLNVRYPPPRTARGGALKSAKR